MQWAYSCPGGDQLMEACPGSQFLLYMLQKLVDLGFCDQTDLWWELTQKYIAP